MGTYYLTTEKGFHVPFLNDFILVAKVASTQMLLVRHMPNISGSYE